VKRISKSQNYSTLITDLASLIEQGRTVAVRYVNTALVVTYWLMGRRIVEYEQKGKERAEYGKELLQKLSQELNRRFGRGFSPDNLEAMRSFYLNYPINISKTVSRKLEEQKSETLSRNSEKSKESEIRYTLGSELIPAQVLSKKFQHEKQRLIEMKIIKKKKE